MSDREGPKWTDIAIVGLTCAIVLLAYMQWREMHDSGEQTDKIIAADQRLAKANERFATSMENTVTQSKNDFDKTLEEMKKQSGAMQNSVDAADRNTKTTIKNAQTVFRDEQRAWVGVETVQMIQFESGKPAQIEFVFFNSGKTPALKTHDASGFTLSAIPISGPSPQSISQMEQELPLSPRQAIAPQGRFKTRLGDTVPTGQLGQSTASAHNLGVAAVIANFDHIKHGDVVFYVYGELQYSDVNGRTHATQYCLFLANSDTKELHFCEVFNELN